MLRTVRALWATLAPRREFAVIGVVCLLGLVVALCGTPPAAAAASGKGKTIQMWYVGPLTGSGDTTGQDGCNGEQLAASDINRAGGLSKGPMKGAHVSVKCIDDADTPSQDTSIAAHYASDPSVWAMGGFYASGNALAAALVAERSNLVILGATVAAPFLTTQVHDVYILNPTLPAAGAAAADFCDAYYGAKKVAGLNPDYSYIAGYMQGAETAVHKDHLKLVASLSWPDPTTTDWSSYLSKVSSAGAQCILLGGYPPEQCAIAAQARQLGMAQPMIDLTESFTSSSCQKEAGSDYEGLIFGNLLPSKNPKGSLAASVALGYQQKYHQVMTYLSAQAYNCVLAVVYAIEDGATNRTQLESYLAKVHGPGAGGPIAFVKRRVGVRFLTFDEVAAHGRLEPVAEYELYPNNSYKRLMVAKCSIRPSCQKRLGASA